MALLCAVDMQTLGENRRSSFSRPPCCECPKTKKHKVPKETTNPISNAGVVHNQPKFLCYLCCLRYLRHLFPHHADCTLPNHPSSKENARRSSSDGLAYNNLVSVLVAAPFFFFDLLAISCIREFGRDWDWCNTCTYTVS